MNPDTIAISMVLGTIASAPLMLALVRMVVPCPRSSPSWDSTALGAPARPCPPAHNILQGVLMLHGVSTF